MADPSANAWRCSATTGTNLAAEVHQVPSVEEALAKSAVAVRRRVVADAELPLLTSLRAACAATRPASISVRVTAAAIRSGMHSTTTTVPATAIVRLARRFSAFENRR